MFNAIFSGSSIVSFKLPNSILSIEYNALGPSSINMAELVVPSSVTAISQPRQYGYIGYVTINAPCNLGWGYCYGRSIKGNSAATFKILYTGGVIPLTTAAAIKGYNKNHYYYVPDALLEDYRAAAQYSEFQSHVLPLSEFPT